MFTRETSVGLVRNPRNNDVLVTKSKRDLQLDGSKLKECYTSLCVL